MGFRLRKSFKIAPGVRVNVGKRGVSTSLGRRGATTNIGRKGVRSTVSIPGSGISYTTKRRGCGCGSAAVIAAMVVSVVVVQRLRGH